MLSTQTIYTETLQNRIHRSLS